MSRDNVYIVYYYTVYNNIVLSPIVNDFNIIIFKSLILKRLCSLICIMHYIYIYESAISDSNVYSCTVMKYYNIILVASEYTINNINLIYLVDIFQQVHLHREPR